MNTLHGMVVDDTYITDSEEPGLLGRDEARRRRIREAFRKIGKGIALAPLLMLPGGKSIALSVAAVKAAKRRIIANRAAKAAKSADAEMRSIQAAPAVEAAPAVPQSYTESQSQPMQYPVAPQYSAQPARYPEPQPARYPEPQPEEYPEPQPAEYSEPEPQPAEESNESEIQSQSDEMYGMDKRIVLWGSAAVIGLIGYYAYKKGYLK